MIVWRITGDEIGPNGNGAAHFATKQEANEAAREHKRNARGANVGGPEQISVSSREQLARALNDAMGFGCS